MSGKVAVVVPSYNRPRMLVEALRSLNGADLRIVVDDGSDFDVLAIAKPHADILIQELTKRPAERSSTPSCGALINRGLRASIEYGAAYAAVLSDDDLLEPGWLAAAAEALDMFPRWHMVCGRWGLFSDPEKPDPAKLCEIPYTLPLTAGNFVYRLSCATDEGCWWREDSLAVHDGAMLDQYQRVHGGRGKRRGWLGVLPMLAGYRRDHPKTVSRHSVFGADQYTPDAIKLFAAGSME